MSEWSGKLRSIKDGVKKIQKTVEKQNKSDNDFMTEELVKVATNVAKIKE